jgi:glycosyltransferase involved in cell wall biosynthesis
MRISYVTTYDATNIQNWSGLGHSIAKMLENQNAEIEYIGNLHTHFEVYYKLKQDVYKLFSNKPFLLNKEPFIAKQYADQVRNKLTNNTDIIFSPGTLPIAFLNTKKPKVFYTDATFAGMIGFYEGYSNLCKETIRHGNYLEQKALESSQLAIYSSDWAARTAIDNYDVNPNKVKVVPFGANIVHSKDLNAIKHIINCRTKNTLNLLFIGVEWIRKGGDLAVKIAKELNARGLKTTLHIVGIRKLPLDHIPDFVINHGFISKSTIEGTNKINELLEKCHFLLVPSIAEAYGLVFCEANAFGLPNISSNVGGISTIIKDDVNGKMFSLNSNVNEWVDYISCTFTNKARYDSFCLSSFNEYKERLNWEVAGKTIMKFIKEL